jgi:hypothetical protein
LANSMKTAAVNHMVMQITTSQALAGSMHIM